MPGETQKHAGGGQSNLPGHQAEVEILSPKSGCHRSVEVVTFGVVLAMFVAWTSPTFYTWVFLGGCLLAIVLLLRLRKAASNKASSRVRVPRGIAVMVVTVFLGLAGSELAIRAFLFQQFPDFERMSEYPSATMGYKHDRTLGWFPVPNSQRKLETAARRLISVDHNSRGFRDAEPTFDNRPRVVFLGDSFVWGSSLEANERFTDKLRARHPEWQVYNFGVVGYGTDQELLLIQKKFAEYKPQVVFLIFFQNDYNENNNNGGGVFCWKPYFTKGPNGLRLHGVPVPTPDWVFCLQHPIISKSYLVRLAMRAYGNFRSPRLKSCSQGATTALLEALRSFVVQRGAVFCVGLVDSDPELEQFLNTLKVPYLKLDTNLRFEADVHWSPEGNTFVANKIEQFLLAHRFLEKATLKEHSSATNSTRL